MPLPNRSRESFRRVGIPLPGLASTRDRSSSTDSSSSGESCPPTPIETVDVPTLGKDNSENRATSIKENSEDEHDGSSGFQAARQMFQFLDRRSRQQANRPAIVPRPSSGPAARASTTSATSATTATAAPSSGEQPAQTVARDETTATAAQYQGGRPALSSRWADLFASLRIASELHSPPMIQTLAVDEEVPPAANLYPFLPVDPLPDPPTQEPFPFSANVSFDVNSPSEVETTEQAPTTPSSENQSGNFNQSSASNETLSRLRSKVSGLELELESKTAEMDIALRLMDEVHVVEYELKKQVEELDEAKKIVEERERTVERTRGTLRSLKIKDSFKTQSEISELMEEITYLQERIKQVEEKQNEENNNDDVEDRADPDDERRDVSCPVCFERPQEIYGCQTCDNLVCGECVGRLDVCPMRRQDFGQMPAVRNRLAERLLNP